MISLNQSFPRTRFTLYTLARQGAVASAALGLAAAGLGSGQPAVASDPPPHHSDSVSLRKYADSLHLVLAATRDSYARQLEALSPANRQIAVTQPGSDRSGALPDPHRMLRLAGQSIAQHGAEFSFVLRSKWPVSPAGAAQTETEEAALDRLSIEPGQAVYARETLGGRSYFTAVYPDRATLASCVECHNRNSSSSRHDFKLGDVMGAVVVRVPLEF